MFSLFPLKSFYTFNVILFYPVSQNHIFFISLFQLFTGAMRCLHWFKHSNLRCFFNGHKAGDEQDSPSSWGNSSHTMAVDVLNPANTDTVNEAPIARPSMKLCSASLRVIIHATVLMLEMRCPRSQWHIIPDTWASWWGEVKGIQLMLLIDYAKEE